MEFSGRTGREIKVNVKSFKKDNGITFPILFDLDGKILEKYKVVEFKATFLVGQEGICEPGIPANKPMNY